MLKNWTSHSDYLHSIQTACDLFNTSELKRLAFLKPSLDKLAALDLDSLLPILKPYYSSTGRPAKHQPEIFRSFILMMDLGELSISNWILKLKSDGCLALLIGCSHDDIPSLGAHYDFINRLWLRSQEQELESLNTLYSATKNHSKSKKPKQNRED